MCSLYFAPPSNPSSRYRDSTPSLFDAKRDKAVSHPMPMRRRSGLEDVGVIMSQVNTVSADQRKVMLRALGKLKYGRGERSERE